MHWSLQVPREADFGANISDRSCCFVGPNLLACHTGNRCITLVDVVVGEVEATRAVRQLTWQPPDEQPVDFQDTDLYPALAAHPSRQELLLSAAGWGTIKVWDVDTGLCTTTITDYDLNVHHALWAGDNKVVATGYSSADDIRSILRWDMGGGGCVPLPDLVWKSSDSESEFQTGLHLACSSEGHLVAASTWPNTCSVLLWDTRTGNEMARVFKDDVGRKKRTSEGGGGGYTAIALDGSGRVAASLDPATGTLHTWDIRTGKLLARVDGLCQRRFASLALNETGTAALCCVTNADGMVAGGDQRSRGGVYDLVLGCWTSSWQWREWDGNPVGPAAICSTRDFGSVASWHYDGTASVWRAT